MAARQGLGPKQRDWLYRIQSAGGDVVTELSSYGPPAYWVPVSGGKPIRLPARMFESLVERNLFVHRGGRWSLKETWESDAG